jgi:hypothetical protein
MDDGKTKLLSIRREHAYLKSSQQGILNKSLGENWRWGILSNC